MSAYVCSRDDRVTRLDWDGTAWAAETVLEGVSASCVATDGRRVLVGSQGDGARLSSDGGESWEPIELPERGVFSVAISGADGARYAGTEPSRLFVSRDGGAWTELEALQEIPSKDQWSFPPRPWTHHVRSIAPDPQVPERLLVGIELGGVMYSEDGGQSFTDHRPWAKRDAHSLAWHPSAEGRAYEAAGDGAAWSRDGGVSWEAIDPDATFATAGHWRSIPSIRTGGTYRPPRARGRRTLARRPPGGSTPGRAVPGGHWPCPETRCPMRSPPSMRRYSRPCRTAASSTAPTAARPGKRPGCGSAQSRRWPPRASERASAEPRVRAAAGLGSEPGPGSPAAADRRVGTRQGHEPVPRPARRMASGPVFGLEAFRQAVRRLAGRVP